MTKATSELRSILSDFHDICMVHTMFVACQARLRLFSKKLKKH